MLTDRAGWFHTGDIAEINDEGFVFILDRAKDLIIRGGENISCAEVESAFYTHPAVMECAAFGLADKRLGERVGLCVVLKPTAPALPPAELLRHVLDGKLPASFKVNATARAATPPHCATRPIARTSLHSRSAQVPLAGDVFVQREQLTRGERHLGRPGV